MNDSISREHKDSISFGTIFLFEIMHQKPYNSVGDCFFKNKTTTKWKFALSRSTYTGIHRDIDSNSDNTQSEG